MKEATEHGGDEDVIIPVQYHRTRDIQLGQMTKYLQELGLPGDHPSVHNAIAGSCSI